VELSAVERGGVVERLREGGGELGLAAGQRREAALAVVPVAGRQVEEGLGQAVVAQAGGDLVGGEGVGEEELDASKPAAFAAAKRSRKGVPGTSCSGSRRSAASASAPCGLAVS
jgi:hypothetical protein